MEGRWEDAPQALLNNISRLERYVFCLVLRFVFAYTYGPEHWNPYM